MKMSKNNFVLYKDFKPNIDILSDEQAGKLFKAIYNYVIDRTEPNFNDGMLIMGFNMVKAQLERDLTRYKERVEVNKMNGAKGGRPKTNVKQSKAKKPNGLIKTEVNQSEAKKGDKISNDKIRYDMIRHYKDNTLNDLFVEFLNIRNKLKAVNSERAINIQLKTLEKYDDDVKKQMLENAISNSWKSVYELKERFNNNNAKESFKPEWTDNVMKDL